MLIQTKYEKKFVSHHMPRANFSIENLTCIPLQEQQMKQPSLQTLLQRQKLGLPIGRDKELLSCVQAFYTIYTNQPYYFDAMYFHGHIHIQS